MPQPKTFGPILPVGIPRELNTCLKHLASLLKNLPASIALDPVDSNYQFGLDPDNIKEEGTNHAFNCALEVAFQTHSLHGVRMHQTPWIECLITAAKDSGAKIPAKCPATADSDDEPEARPKKAPQQSITIVLTEDDSDMKLLPAPQRQGTLFQFGCKKIDAEQGVAQQRKVLEEKREAMRAAGEREKQQKAHAAETKTELN
ncbi:hypothetical protein B0H14DRAFT_2658694 [Mycena olivaceomarginata]|nr:hypothetical protein B0H14DRAFT_2658694 [Mycena olivaceomarginata]